MKVATLGAVALTLIMGVSLANAKGRKPKRVSGSITKIDGASITIQPKTRKNATDAPAPVVVTTTDATKVTINGESKAVKDLTVDEKVMVTLDTDGTTATAITVGKKKKKKAEAPAATTEPAPTTAPAANN